MPHKQYQINPLKSCHNVMNVTKWIICKIHACSWHLLPIYIYLTGADPGKNPTGALYASKWAWSGVVVLVEVIMAMDFRYRINNV